MADNAQMKESIRDWWASRPMTYAHDHGGTTFDLGGGAQRTVALGSREFFELADRRFYGWNEPLHTGDGPFGRIFDYERFRGKRVLEIGCGMGCMAMNWAQRGALLTAVDLNPTSIAQTRRRFELFGLAGDIRESDAARLPFEDATFDYVYSWGVLHHTPETKRTIDEIHRVLKPGGETGVMLYHRDSFLYRYSIKYLEGFLHYESAFLDDRELANRYSDGGREEGNPHTWPVTRDEARRVLFDRFAAVDFEVFGTDVVPIFDQWFPRLGSVLLPLPLVKACARRWGWSLWTRGRKAD
jgi:ubiquinone/menaquinone biosynthesis C-methylase UbiE